MSLLEITIAMIVLSVVVLSAGTVYVSGLKELNRCTDEAKVQKEVFYALDHMFLYLMGASGPITLTPNSITAYTTESAGVTEPIKYDLNSGRIRFTYKVGEAGQTIEYITDSDITVDSLNFSRPVTKNMDGTGGAINNYVAVDITASSGRMQESYGTGVVLRGMSGA